VRRRADRLKLALGAAVAVPLCFIAGKRVRVSLGFGEIDVDSNRDDVPDPCGILRGCHRGECRSQRESEDVDAIDVQTLAQGIDDGADVGRTLGDADRRRVGVARSTGAAVIPVGNDRIRLEVQSSLDRAPR